ncbi:Helix-turn-helix domain containing protein [uncultured Caudovirales phage]|uniref:Helix-turn-helix domain containing protein n=1 Tax=uncultured Caudovirales phage TaxID=2100421 RepID=A0A6J7WXK0_9CAUD|nr:Helix-turn-helix domain containing protein [uncultured Caudovirales phage]
MTTNTERVLEALRAGEELTAKQISSRFGISNPTATIHSLRSKGYPIYLNNRKTKTGTSSKYRIGTPKRSVIAAGYAALGAAAFA